MAESVMLTPEEQRWLKPLFDKYDLEDSAIVMGDKLRPLLERSGLPGLELSQIWNIVDTENRGFLDFDSFAKVLRLVYHAQHGLPLSPRLANIPAGIPDLNRAPELAANPPGVASPQATSPPAAPPQGLRSAPMQPHARAGSVSTQPLAAFSTGGSTFSDNGETRIPPMTTADKKRFGALFDREVGPSGYIEGAQARDIFLKARLPQETLGKVWSLIDIDGRGKLTKNEFVVAMHLIQSLISKSMTQLPSALPASWQPWLGSGHARQGSTAAARQPAAPAAPALSAAAPALSSPPPPPPPAGKTATAPAARVASLSIAPNERAQFDAIFDSLDQAKTGILGPNEAVPVLTKSGLSEEVLARVWDLADTRSRGQLDRGDFALAMHFVKAKLNGLELPDHVAAGAGALSQTAQPAQPAQPAPQPTAQPTAQADSGPQPARFLSPQTTQQTPAAPMPRSMTGQPASPPEPRVQRRSATSSLGSLSDLVSLDSAVFKPLEPAKPAPQPLRRAATDVDEKKFVPASAFGQQLLQKQQRSLPTHFEESESPKTASTAAPVSAAPASTAPAASTSSPVVPAAAAPARSAASPLAGQFASAHEQQKQVNELSAQITASKAEQARANEDLATVLKNKDELERKLRDLKATYDNGTREVHETQQRIKAARDEIKQLEKETSLRTSGLEAIKTQHAQEKQTLETVLAEKARLEEQHATHESTVKSLQTETSTFQEQRQGHERTIAEYERTIAQFETDLAAAKWQRQKVEEEANLFRLKASQMHAQAESLQQQLAEETRAAAEAKALSQAAEREPASVPASVPAGVPAGGPIAVPANVAVEVPASARAPAPTTQAPVVKSVAIAAAESIPAESIPAESIPASIPTESSTVDSSTSGLQKPEPTRSLSFGSEPVTHNTSVDTPRTSPPTSEANFAGPQAEPGIPSFTLPMQRPYSATSSVVNNAPQSVRGDLGSETSGRPSPEFPARSTTTDGVESPLNLGSENSFEFVDARSDPDAVPRNLSSSDEEGPETAIPQKYGAASPLPAMPGTFPSAEESSGEIVEATAETETPEVAPQPEAQQAPQQAPQPQPAPQPAPEAQTLQAAPATLSRIPSKPPPYAQAVGATKDEFDEFDDLEDAKEDDGEDDGLYQTERPNVGPDEWQQLFAKNNQSVTSMISQDSTAIFHVPANVPALQNVVSASNPQESRELAELTSMGFSVDEARSALQLHGHNLSEATNYLLDNMR